MDAKQAKQDYARSLRRSFFFMVIISVGAVVYGNGRSESEMGTVIGFLVLGWIMWAVFMAVLALVQIFRYGTEQEKTAAVGITAVIVGLLAGAARANQQSQRYSKTATASKNLPASNARSTAKPASTQRTSPYSTKTCSSCSGTGKVKAKRTCTQCNGKGSEKVWSGTNKMKAMGIGESVSQDCPRCFGMGYKMETTTCKTCAGTGKVKV